MGSVMTEGKSMKRLGVLIVMLSLAMSMVAHADTTYSPAYTNGPQGGDQYNQIQRDGAAGSITVMRVNPAGISGGLGCGGTGGFSDFDVQHTASSPITQVRADFKNAALDPYTWITLSLIGPGGYVGTAKVRGVVAGTGTAVLNIAPADRIPAGPVTVRFGIEVASACPNVDGGTATFTAVTIV